MNLKKNRHNKRVIMTLPLGFGVGSHVVSYSLYLALKSVEDSVTFLSPFMEQSKLAACEEHIEKKSFQTVLDNICALVEQAFEKNRWVVLEGVCQILGSASASYINARLSKALRAHVVFITCPTLQQTELLERHVALSKNIYLENSRAKSLGVIVNKFGFEEGVFEKNRQNVSALKASNVLAVIPWDKELFSFSVEDLLEKVKGLPFFKMEDGARLITSFQYIFAPRDVRVEEQTHTHLLIISSRHVEGLEHLLKALEECRERPFILVTDSAKNSVQSDLYKKLAKCTNLMTTSKKVEELMVGLGSLVLFPPLEQDLERLEVKAKTLARFIHGAKIIEKCERDKEGEDASLLTPTQFRYFIKSRAKFAKKTILLPESGDDRVLKAASIAKSEGIANIALVGDLETINKRCKELSLKPFLEKEVFSIEKEAPALVNALVEIRKHKGMNGQSALKALQSPIVLSTMLLKSKRVDGIVAGASTTTADTIRPAFQIIKTRDQGGQVSSLFFICFEKKTVIFADCAVSVDPSASEIASIAIETSKTAAKFGFDPKIALLSYSTLESGKGVSVDKVKEALKIIRAQDSSLKVDGPLQFDAAFEEETAKIKAGDSLIAGDANIYIFPSLDAGNIAYKAATKVSGSLAIGPVLQGLNQPVNDLSRGAGVDDIVYTIAVTAISS
ncbi:phosphate acetyltransferase [Candidatus Aerophobetes bacterium]|uniref:Phosphate acetyltransferase n=1 Tax=Aerophobetes bacterium TaxID=2030807 RepID=A0A2A4WZW1_UNCAE|nr:MAG: phosphate acetyltransferase [Candidatus Aerophobetes bacterium]